MEEEKDFLGTEIKDWFNKWLPLIVIMLLQGISLICLPMFDFSSESNEIIKWHNPEWYEWLFTIISEVLTVTTFIGFSIQGKLNVKDDARKLEADRILGKLKIKEAKPQSPKSFESKAYISKGITVSITTIGTCLLVPVIAINFNVATLMSLAISSMTSIVFGILNMKRFEDYYTHEYVRYAEWKAEESKQVSTEVEDKEKKECLNLETKNLEI